jgi:hypothetical protein
LLARHYQHLFTPYSVFGFRLHPVLKGKATQGQSTTAAQRQLAATEKKEPWTDGEFEGWDFPMKTILQVANQPSQ